MNTQTTTLPIEGETNILISGIAIITALKTLVVKKIETIDRERQERAERTSFAKMSPHQLRDIGVDTRFSQHVDERNYFSLPPGRR